MEYSLQHSEEEDSNIDNSMEMSIRETRKCYKVQEESDEEENSEIDSVNDLSNDRIKQAEEVEA